jgi:hypothetical protein
MSFILLPFCNTAPEKLERTRAQNDSRQDTKNDFKIPSKRKEMFRPTPQKMAGLCYVTPVTCQKADTGKEEEDHLEYKIKYGILQSLCLSEEKHLPTETVTLPSVSG